ncbi:hypothetical protein EV1_031633 [Malus domestica]
MMSTTMAEPEPFVLHINPSAVPQLIHSAHEPAAFEQFVLQIGQSTAALPAVQIKPSDSAPPPPHHGTGILNLKVVEPILLHINSLSPPTPPPPPAVNSLSPPTPPPPPAVNSLSPSTPPPPPADTLIPITTTTTTPTTTNNNNKPRQKVLSAAGSLANLLPTGTVLAFQAVTPSLSFNGRCHEFNKYLVAFVILVCSVICFVSSFTDSLKGKGDKVYYGIATSNGLWVFNNGEIEERELLEELEKLKVKNRDFLHAFLSVFLFLIFAFSSSEVQGCYFPESRELEYSLATYLPLVAGLLATLLFTMVPTKRRGIGYNY